MNTMKWLLKREYWEHKGGFVWVPVILSTLMLLATLASVIAGKAMGKFSNFQVDGEHVTLSEAGKHVSPEDQVKIVEGLSAMFVGPVAPLIIALSFVLFFYLIGALYDDRSNRSVLFWKSLPVSDTATVVSKVVWALVVAPLITLAVAIATYIPFLLLTLVAMSMAGLNLFGAVLSESRTYLMPLEFLGTLPVYMVWALPTVGWLLMVSAWAKSKPFLWSIGLPMATALLLGWANSIFDLGIKLGWFMQNVVGRLLLSILPGSWGFLLTDPASIKADSLDKGSPLLSSWAVMATPEMWIGAVVGIAMIVVAIRLRRFRDEG